MSGVFFFPLLFAGAISLEILLRDDEARVVGGLLLVLLVVLNVLLTFPTFLTAYLTPVDIAGIEGLNKGVADFFGAGLLGQILLSSALVSFAVETTRTELKEERSTARVLEIVALALVVLRIISIATGTPLPIWGNYLRLQWNLRATQGAKAFDSLLFLERFFRGI